VSLILHAGASPVTYDELRLVPTPPPTDTHFPISHHEIVELARYTLGFYQHEIVEEHFGVTPDGARFFGLMSLRSPYGDYTDVLGLRNSSDKSFPVSLAFGSRVFVCDNLAFIGETVIRRKHTANAKRALPSLISDIVAPLQAQRIAQSDKLLRYKGQSLTDAEADHVILTLYRKQVIGVQKIADVVREWETPSHDWGHKNAWRLFNATTFALTGKVAERPDLTRQLHQVIDGVCEEIGHA